MRTSRTSAQRAADIRTRIKRNKRNAIADARRGKVRHFHDLSEFMPKEKAPNPEAGQ